MIGSIFRIFQISSLCVSGMLVCGYANHPFFGILSRPERSSPAEIEMMATATFQDLYYGQTPMILMPFKTSRASARVTRFRWVKDGANGCIVTGYSPSGFASPEAGIAAASRHARFSNIAA